MGTINFSARVFASGVPRQTLSKALGKISGRHSSSLFTVMHENGETIGSLAHRTKLTLEQVKRTVFGRKPPLSSGGFWTREAMLISEALATEPSALFSDVLAEIRASVRVSLSQAQEVFHLSVEPYVPDEIDLQDEATRLLAYTVL